MKRHVCESVTAADDKVAQDQEIGEERRMSDALSSRAKKSYSQPRFRDAGDSSWGPGTAGF